MPPFAAVAGMDDPRGVETVFDDLLAYAVRVDGIATPRESARQFIEDSPAGHSIGDTHALVIQYEAQPVGLLHLVAGYPAAGTAFIGLLAVREAAQGRGFGRSIFEGAERLARDLVGAHMLRLAVVDSNPVSGFWITMGFQFTGEAKPFEGKARSSRVRTMEKRI